MGNHEIMYFVLSYFVGSIPTGFIVFWYSKKNDIRNEGSGNTGATNILRTCGKKAAIITLLADILKGAVPVAYGIIHFKYSPLIIGGGALAIIGHIFPVWLKFKGGKGVATFAGAFLAYMGASDGILIFPIFVFSFGISMLYSKTVSISSLSGISGAFFAVLFTNVVEVSLIVLLVNILIVIKHKENIARIISGKEHTFHRRNIE